ncbi:hypothetical protein [Tenacibaculum aiptasiae]|uniref:hypothetical protein n=1 Tax=Tenacibaculum aiptasiae TaxID=426481 RepID=UPI0015880A6A|nr:hypothetical protein [Tenacibaculum aiptasiae]
MNVKNLTQKELININGGDQGTYDAGYAVGKHVRASIIAVGSAISWLFDQADKIIPG